MTYFLDANIISYVIRQVPSVISKIKSLIDKDAEIKIPVISYYEVKRGLLANNSKNRLKIFDAQIKTFGLVQMTDSTLDIAAQIYALLKLNGSIIEDADLFIGSSALEHNAILLTNNVKHLGKIPNLNLEVVN